MGAEAPSGACDGSPGGAGGCGKAGGSSKDGAERWADSRYI